MQEYEKRLAGAPSKYTPDIGRKILEYMEQGYSLVAAAAHVEIGRQTVYDWKAAHPEFKALIELGMSKRQAHWEKEALETQSGPRVTMISKALAGTKDSSWSDSQSLEITGPGGTPLFQAITFNVIDSRPSEPLAIEGEYEEVNE